MLVKQILEGHINELLGKEEALHKQRMAICLKCPLFKNGTFGPICNPDLYLNPTTGVFNHTGGLGFFRGCSCRLNAKTRLEDAHCPANKW